MQIPQPTAGDRARFLSLVPDDPGVEVKPMFGSLGAFVNGNMFMGLFGSAIGLKLEGATRRRC
jgi:TfoX/Sxy family transcriptional regulator of competence genes